MKKLLSLFIILIFCSCSPYYAIPFKATVNVTNSLGSCTTVSFSTGEEGKLHCNERKSFLIEWKGERIKTITMYYDKKQKLITIQDGGSYEMEVK